MTNTFGNLFCLTTFGESHGSAIGGVIDGLPSGITIDEEFIQSELERRRPGRNGFATGRKEQDNIELLSGIFEGKSTGTPIGFIIRNTNQKSGDYDNIKNIFRPGHADFTYFHKYGIRDYRGGGRSSARETAVRVAGGALAKLLLQEIGISLVSGVSAIGEFEAKSYDFERVAKSPIYALSDDLDVAGQELIESIKNNHDSVGGSVIIKAMGLPVGLGEPMYHKLDGALGGALLGLNGVKAVEIGEGIHCSKRNGSENNDPLRQTGFISNHAGGILGGISTSQDLIIKIHFKPTPSIFLTQQTVTLDGEEIDMNLKGRHDPCIAIRGSVVAEAMCALVLADMVLLNLTRRIDTVKKGYGCIVS